MYPIGILGTEESYVTRSNPDLRVWGEIVPRVVSGDRLRLARAGEPGGLAPLPLPGRRGIRRGRTPRGRGPGGLSLGPVGRAEDPLLGTAPDPLATTRRALAAHPLR